MAALFRLLLCAHLLSVQEAALEAASSAPESTGWVALTAWLLEHGGMVHQDLHIGLARHGDAEIRGLVVDKAVKKGTTLLRVPKKLWIGHSAFPDLVAPDEVRGSRLAAAFLEDTKMAAAVALEMKRGDESFYAPHLRMLPSLQELKALLPMFAPSDIIDDFHDVPVAGYLRDVSQAKIAAIRHNFEAWQTVPESPVADLGWEEMLGGLHLLATRSLGSKGALGEQSNVPAADLANTAVPSKVNAGWAFKGDAFELFAQKPVKAGGEILLKYCNGCDNELMTATWGIYLEDNPTAMNDIVDVNCSAAWTTGTNGTRPSATATSLKAAALDALDIKQASVALKARRTAPRCQSAVSGSVRCTLARLAWERCASEWGYDDWEDVEREASKAAPQYHGVTRHNLRLTFENRGDTLKSEANYTGAESSYRAALEIAPNSADLHCALGDVLKKQGDLEGARSILQKATEVKPQHARSHEMLGDVLHSLGDVKAAVKSYKTAMQIDPSLQPVKPGDARGKDVGIGGSNFGTHVEL